MLRSQELTTLVSGGSQDAPGGQGQKSATDQEEAQREEIMQLAGQVAERMDVLGKMWEQLAGLKEQEKSR